MIFELFKSLISLFHSFALLLFSSPLFFIPSFLLLSLSSVDRIFGSSLSSNVIYYGQALPPIILQAMEHLKKTGQSIKLIKILSLQVCNNNKH